MFECSLLNGGIMSGILARSRSRERRGRSLVRRTRCRKHCAR